MTTPRRLIVPILAALLAAGPASATLLKGAGHPHRGPLSRGGGVALAVAGVGLVGAIGGALVMRRRRPTRG
jgi:hypothetical protein